MSFTGASDYSFCAFCSFRSKIARGLNVLSPAAGLRKPEREMKVMRTCETCNRRVSCQDVSLHRGLCRVGRGQQRFMCQTCCQYNLSSYWSSAEEMELGLALAGFSDMMELVFTGTQTEYYNRYAYEAPEEPVKDSKKRKLEDKDQESGPSKRKCLPQNEAQNVPEEVLDVPEVEPQEEVMDAEAQEEEPNENARPFARRRIVKTRGVHPRPRDASGCFVKCETRQPNKMNRGLLPTELDRLKSSLFVGVVLSEEVLADKRPIACCTRSATNQKKGVSFRTCSKTSRKC